jgi:alpha-1,3-mannosyltransferase
MLRLFNDCFTVFFMWLAIYFYQKKSWSIGSSVLTCALGVKMNVLLAVPGIAFVLLQSIGVDRSITQALIVAQSQGLFAYEFVKYDWRAYLSRAFQLNRQFFYKWTVNWRFIPKEIFLSSKFSYGLLAAHVALLLVFMTTRWTAPSRRSFKKTLALFFRHSNTDAADAVAPRVTPDYILTTIVTANAIGMLYARSLHYQFYSWIAWTTPWLLWKSGLGPVFVVGVWAAQEWAWNVYPSTDASSTVAVACLAAQVIGVWWGTRKDAELINPPAQGDGNESS